MKQKVTLMLLATFLCCVLGVQAQTGSQITGKVIDAMGELPGVSVVVKGTTNGTITGIDGSFKLNNVKPSDILLLSFVGYKTQEIKVGNQKNFNITMAEDAQALDEVVVVAVGYGDVKRRDLTGSIGKANMKDLTKVPVTNVAESLGGRIAGVNVTSTDGGLGDNFNIVIRGAGSLTQSTAPLYVIDGFPSETSGMGALNPNDIESIDVLKDASATAIYGSRGANGVVIITTKKGKVGKPVINFSTKLTYSPKLNIDRLNLLNSEEKVGLELDLLASGYPYRETKGEVYRIISGLGELNNFKDGGWNALSSSAQSAIKKLKATNTDWSDILFRDAFTQEYNLSLSGGSEKATYYTSFGYMKENGNVPNVSAERLNLVMKTSYKVNSILKVGASMFANRRKNSSYLPDSDGLTNPIFYSRLANPYFTPYNEHGNYNYDIDVENDVDMDFGFNPFEELKNTTNETTINGLSSIFDAELRFDDRFKFTTQLGLQLDKTSIEKIADEESCHA